MEPLPLSQIVRPGELPGHRPYAFRLAPDAAMRAALAPLVGASALPALTFEGTIAASGRDEVRLEGHLTATAVQPCVVTLAPVTTRIAETVCRRYLADLPEPEAEETEIPEDTDTEPMPASLDLAEVMAEALALALPLYPRASGVPAPAETPAVETHRPFSGLDRLLGGTAVGDAGQDDEDGAADKGHGAEKK